MCWISALESSRRHKRRRHLHKRRRNDHERHHDGPNCAARRRQFPVAAIGGGGRSGGRAAAMQHLSASTAVGSAAAVQAQCGMPRLPHYTLGTGAGHRSMTLHEAAQRGAGPNRATGTFPSLPSLLACLPLRMYACVSRPPQSTQKPSRPLYRMATPLHIRHHFCPLHRPTVCAPCVVVV